MKGKELSRIHEIVRILENPQLAPPMRRKPINSIRCSGLSQAQRREAIKQRGPLQYNREPISRERWIAKIANRAGMPVERALALANKIIQKRQEAAEATAA